MRSPSSKRFVLGAVAGLLVAGALLAQAGSTNVPNWTVPPYRANSASGGLQTMVDISDAGIFVAITTCRVFDTRDPVGPYGGPRLAANVTRNFDIDSGPCTGIPAGASAYSMNFGAILPDGAGSFITIWPTGAAQPTSSFMNPIQGAVVANAAVIPASSTGSISVFPNTGVHLYGDINGYFMDSGGQLNDNVTLRVAGSDPNEPSIYGLNFDTSSASSGVNGVRGYVNSPLDNPVGVFGLSDNAAGRTYGVMGQGDSAAAGAAGVYGLGGSGSFGGSITALSAAGMVAVGRDANGINAFSSGIHSAGHFRAYSGATLVSDMSVGFNEFGAFAVFTQIGGAYFDDGIQVSGTKNFVQPHPTDPSKQIQYISVEAPRSEVFFRGSAQVQLGVTRIEIPEEFRLVAKPGTYSAMVTPVGAMATVAVMAEDEDGIVVQASRNVKINYVIYALRDGFEDVQAIVPNQLFVPGYEGTFNPDRNEWARTLMRRNGTLNPDGTANLETARRLGWHLRPKAENPAEQRLQPEPVP